MKRSILLASLFFAVLSCQKDSGLIDTEIPEPDPEPVLFTATAYTESTDSTKINFSETETTFTRLWQDNDSFVLYDGSNQHQFTLSSGSGTTDGTFTSSTEPASSSTYYGVYPYSTTYQFTSSEITLDYPESVTYDKDSSPTLVTGSDLLVYKGTSQNKYSFRAVNCYIRLTISVPSGAGVSLSSLKIMGNNNEKITGKASISFDANGIPSVTMSDKAKTILTVNFNPVIMPGNTVTLTLALPPVLTSGIRLMMYDTAGKQLGVSSTSTFSRNVMTVMPELSYTSPYNIVYGKSNCYLLKPGDTSVTFDISAYSYNNSFIGDYKTKKIAAIPCSASLINSGFNTLTINNMTISNSDDGGYELTVPVSGSGNAHIAIKDSDGKILWSYHIWKPSIDAAADSNLKQYSINGKTYNVLPLPLGAIDVVSSTTSSLSSSHVGLLYQWGRKDPFRNDKVLSDKSEISDKSELLSNVAYSILHPSTFISASKSPYSWCVTSESASYQWKSLWADSTGSTDVSILKKKSVFDPSPEGYRVAPSDTYINFTYNSSSSNINAKLYSNGYYFYYVPYYSGITGDTDFYPAPPFIDNNGGLNNSSGCVSYYWKSKPKGAMYFTNGSVKNNTFNSADAFSVKCVKMTN